MNPRKLFPKWLILALLLWSATSISAWKRAYSPMSDYVRRATLIALIDSGPRDERGQITLTFREIWKGEAKEGISIPQSPRMGPTVPPDVRGWAALFETDAKGELRLLETYGKPEQIEALREVIRIAALPDERARLEAWRALLPNSNPLYAENFLWELREMRDPNNFPLLLNSLDEFDEAGKSSLVRLVGEIGDARGVPWLLERMNVADPTPAQQKIAREAAGQLSIHFPNASGVPEAFRAALEKAHLKDAATYYLAKRDSKLRAGLRPQTPYSRAQAHAEAGEFAQARRLWLKIVEDATTNDWTRLDVAMRLAKTRAAATPTNMERERRAVLPHLARLAREGDYVQTENVVKLLRDWHGDEAIEPLLAVLERKTERILEKSQQIAFAALFERGPEARNRAAAVLTARLGSEKADNIDSFDAILLPLGWLADAASETSIAALLDDSTRRQWEKLSPLRHAARSEDETAALIDLLRKRDSIPFNAISWIVFRLSEKRDPRALEPLATLLANSSGRTTGDAIVRIGGPQAEREVELLLRHPNDDVRRRAVDLLVELQGARALPLLRRMINEPNFGSRSGALFQLAYFGTPDDLPLLLKLSDYWTGDRANHYWITHAIANIRSRYHLDVNGAI